MPTSKLGIKATLGRSRLNETKNEAKTPPSAASTSGQAHQAAVFPAPGSVFPAPGTTSQPKRAPPPVAERAERPKTAPAQHHQPNDNISVCVRFRPLNHRETAKGEHEFWRPDGKDQVVSTTGAQYAYDKVFDAEATSQRVYSDAVVGVVWAAMDGINGTVFAYGVTSSGKTYTMQGNHKAPGMIPMAVADVFRIIQDSPQREFLLRVSYMEIYNEVVNDLLDPLNTNLRIREDSQAGVYVEGVKEEVVVSAHHCLSLIKAGEAHRHVGSTNYNEISSRSHTIFRMTVESTTHVEDKGVMSKVARISQLSLIDLAGSESSKVDTLGVRRKEGGYINKSLLTLGTVIAKLSEGNAAHVPYRDSKLTRLLQTSLTGNARITMVCTVTPGSGSAEETHNTLKFAARAKKIELHAHKNEILDDKSLIKKYQKEIQQLREQLDALQSFVPPNAAKGDNSAVVEELKQKYEEGKMQLEREEEEKVALHQQITRLKKLILVSTRYVPGSSLDTSAELPSRSMSFTMAGGSASLLQAKAKKRGFVGYLKSKYRSLQGTPTSGKLPASYSTTSPDKLELYADRSFVYEGEGMPTGRRRSDDGSLSGSGSTSREMGAIDSEDEFSPTESTPRRRLSVSAEDAAAAEHIELLLEQVRTLAAEIKDRDAALVKLRGGAAAHAKDGHSKEDDATVASLRKEIVQKNLEMSILEQKIEGAKDQVPQWELDSKMVDRLRLQLGEKNFELMVTAADKNFLQEQMVLLNDELEELRTENGRLMDMLDRDNNGSSSLGNSSQGGYTSLRSENSRLKAEVEAARAEAARLEAELHLGLDEPHQRAGLGNHLAVLDPSASASTRATTDSSNSAATMTTGATTTTPSISTTVPHPAPGEAQSRATPAGGEQQRAVQRASGEAATPLLAVTASNAGSPRSPATASLQPGTPDAHVAELVGSLEEKVDGLRRRINALEGKDLEQLDEYALEQLLATQRMAIERTAAAQAALRQRAEQPLQQTRSSLENAGVCMRCRARGAGVLFLPCRHFCVCEDCSTLLEECPLCQSTISQRVVTDLS